MASDVRTSPAFGKRRVKAAVWPDNVPRRVVISRDIHRLDDRQAPVLEYEDAEFVLAIPTHDSFWPWVKTLLYTVFDQPDADSVHAQFDRDLDALQQKLPKSFEHLEASREETLAFTAFPKEIWRQIWSNEPLNREFRRRTDVVGIFPDRNSIIRLVGAVLAEQHDEWANTLRYLGLEALAKSRRIGGLTNDPEEVTESYLHALCA